MTPRLTSDALTVQHGFFTRAGGVSIDGYASLNGSLSGGDDSHHVAENRRRAADALDLAPAALHGVTQVHGSTVVTFDRSWAYGSGPMADAVVTDRPGIGLCIITADCAPILLADPAAGVIGAAHAGWRGAVGGVLEATVAAMQTLGARHITAAVGPCIAQASYQVGADVHAAVADDRFFRADGPAWRFDLAGYCAARLAAAGTAATILHADTYAHADAFFSHRRRTHAGGGAIGHQMSAIRL